MPRSRFTTSIKKYSVESEPIVFPIRFGPTELNKTIKNLLKDNGIDSKNVKFNFFINGDLIEGPLKDFIELKAISEEIEEIVYDIEIEPPTLENETKLEERIFTMKFHSKWLACANRDLEIIDTTSPAQPVVSIPTDIDMLTVDWISLDDNSNEAVIITGEKFGSMYSWKCDLTNGTAEKQFDYRGHTKDVWHLAVSPDRALIASGCSDGLLKIWSTSQEITDLSEETGGIPHVSKTKNAHKLPIRIPLVTMLAHDRVCCVKWSDPAIDVSDTMSDSSEVKSTSGNLITSGLDHLLKLWHINGYESTLVRQVKVSNHIRTMDPNRTNQLILAGSPDTRLRCFDFRAAKSEVHSIFNAHSHCLTDVKWSPTNSNMFVTSCFNGVTKLWDARNMKSASSVIAKFPLLPVTCSDWSVDGTLLANSYIDGSLRFYRFDL